MIYQSLHAVPIKPMNVFRPTVVDYITYLYHIDEWRGNIIVLCDPHLKVWRYSVLDSRGFIVGIRCTRKGALRLAHKIQKKEGRA